MKLIDITSDMENKLSSKRSFSNEMVNHLKYTQNFYLLIKGNKKVMTNKKITLISLQSFMDLREHEAFVLLEDEALEALKVLETPDTNKVSEIEPVVKEKEIKKDFFMKPITPEKKDIKKDEPIAKKKSDK